MCGSNNLVMVGMFEVLWKTTSSLFYGGVVDDILHANDDLHCKICNNRRHLAQQRRHPGFKQTMQNGVNIGRRCLLQDGGFSTG